MCTCYACNDQAIFFWAPWSRGKQHAFTLFCVSKWTNLLFILQVQNLRDKYDECHEMLLESQEAVKEVHRRSLPQGKVPSFSSLNPLPVFPLVSCPVPRGSWKNDIIKGCLVLRFYPRFSSPGFLYTKVFFQVLCKGLSYIFANNKEYMWQNQGE